MRELTCALLSLATAGSAFAGNATSVGDEPETLGHVFRSYQAAQAQRVAVAGGRTTVSTETNLSVPEYGAFPLPVYIDNTSGPRQTIRIVFRSTTGGASRNVTREVEVAQGERRTVTLVLFSSMRSGVIEAHGAGVAEESPKPLYFATAYEPQHTVLVLGAPERFEAFVRHPPVYSGADTMLFSLAPGDAPTDTMAYSGFDAVVLPEETTLESLNEAQREALERMTLTGGSLVIHGPLRGAASLPLLPKTAVGVAAPYGLGHVTVTESRGLADASVAWRERPVLPTNSDPRRYNGARPWDALLPQAQVPVGRFMVIITLFTLLIGPGSVWVSRRRGPAALLVTIPGTALITCVLIISYSLIADGFTVHGAVFGYTRLDRERNRAVTVGLTAYYANLGPGSVRFDGATTLVPPTTENEREQVSASLEWRDGLRVGSEFLPSRVYREWGVAEVAPTRARLVVKREGGGWVVQNALGGRVTELVVNVEGKQLFATDVPEGGQATLSPVSSCSQLEGDASCMFHAIDSRVENRFSEDVKRQFVKGAVPKGEFAAYVEGQGFVPTGGVSLSLTSSKHLVRGEYTP